MLMVCIFSAEDDRVHRRGGGEFESVGGSVSAAAPSRDPHERRHRGVRRVHRFPLHPLAAERARHLLELRARRQRRRLHARARQPAQDDVTAASRGPQVLGARVHVFLATRAQLRA